MALEALNGPFRLHHERSSVANRRQRQVSAHVECQVERIVEMDVDHAVVILRVVDAEFREKVRPLTIAETLWEYGG